MADAAGATLGVDVGSARVKAAVAGPDGVVQLVRFDGGAEWLDMGALVEADGTVLAGAAARERTAGRPGGWVPHPLDRLTAGGLEVGGVPVEAADLVAAVLRRVRTSAAALVGGTPSDVRVVVPASWGPRRRTALRLALHRAGFDQPELIAGAADNDAIGDDGDAGMTRFGSDQQGVGNLDDLSNQPMPAPCYLQ